MPGGRHSHKRPLTLGRVCTRTRADRTGLRVASDEQRGSGNRPWLPAATHSCMRFPSRPRATRPSLRFLVCEWGEQHPPHETVAIIVIVVDVIIRNTLTAMSQHIHPGLQAYLQDRMRSTLQFFHLSLQTQVVRPAFHWCPNRAFKMQVPLEGLT